MTLVRCLAGAAIVLAAWLQPAKAADGDRANASATTESRVADTVVRLDAGLQSIPRGLAIDATQRPLAVADGDAVRILDRASLTTLAAQPVGNGAVDGVAFGPASHIVLARNFLSLTWWHWGTGQRIGVQHDVRQAAASADGRRAAGGGRRAAGGGCWCCVIATLLVSI